MSPRSDDTIVLPMTTTRADGINPDVAPPAPIERAIFSHPGRLTLQRSPCWMTQVPVQISRIVFAPGGFANSIRIEVQINLVTAGWVDLTNSTVRTINAGDATASGALPVGKVVNLTDKLTVIATNGPNRAVLDLSVFVSFTAAP